VSSQLAVPSTEPKSNTFHFIGTFTLLSAAPPSHFSKRRSAYVFYACPFFACFFDTPFYRMALIVDTSQPSSKSPIRNHHSHPSPQIHIHRHISFHWHSSRPLLPRCTTQRQSIRISHRKHAQFHTRCRRHALHVSASFLLVILPRLFFHYFIWILSF